MKASNNSVKGLHTPKNATLFWVKPLPPGKHKINDYGMLDRVISKQVKKKTKKRGFSYSQRDLYLTGREEWCSLDKMVEIDKQKNEQIRRHINEKAQLEGRNQELKMMMLNPTLREHELNQKIYKLEAEVDRMKKLLEQKDVQHRQQITSMKENHLKQIKAVEQRYISSSLSRYQTNAPSYTYSLAGQNNNGNSNANTYVQSRPQQSNRVSYQSYQPQKGIQNANRTTAQPKATSYYSSTNTYQKKEQSNNNSSKSINQPYTVTINKSNPNILSSSSIRYEQIPKQKDSRDSSPQYVNVFTGTSSNYPYSNRNSKQYSSSPQKVSPSSPNESKNTTSNTHVAPKQGFHDNKGRPVSFAGQSSTGMSSAQIENIYKRYCLND